MRDPSPPERESEGRRDGFVHVTLRGDEDPRVIVHYAKTLASMVSRRDHGVHWYEIVVAQTGAAYVARLVAHLPSKDVLAETSDPDAFLAIRNAFDDLSRQLTCLGDLRIGAGA